MSYKMKTYNTLELNLASSEILEVSLNRPEKHNAMSFEMVDELILLAKEIKKNKKIRGVIIQGKGESFCSGLDLNELRDPKNRLKGFLQLISPIRNTFQKVNLIWKTLPVPVVSVIHGNCFGAGMQFVLGSDFRVAHSETRFSIMESKWGLIPDMGITKTLKDLTSPDIAMELCMSAKIFNPKEAKQFGLISYVSTNPLEKANELLNSIICRSPDAISGVKSIINKMVLSPGYFSLAKERLWQLKLLAGKNSKIAIKKDKNPEIKFNDRTLG